MMLCQRKERKIKKTETCEEDLPMIRQELSEPPSLTDEDVKLMRGNICSEHQKSAVRKILQSDEKQWEHLHLNSNKHSLFADECIDKPEECFSSHICSNEVNNVIPELAEAQPKRTLSDVSELSDRLNVIALNNEILPYNESQLFALYPNAKLDELPNVVEDFLQHEHETNNCSFYELVLNYYLARCGLASTNKVIENCRKKYAEFSGDIWSFQEETVTETGYCEDGEKVSCSETHETVHYNENISSDLVKELKQLREIVFESHSLHSFKVEMFKLKVEDYLQTVILALEKFQDIPKFSPVSCKESNDDLVHLEDMKRCISVLFSFVRRNANDPVFVREIKTWISDLVSIFLRLASYKDHYFLINHVLRCPAGSGIWAQKFIQILPPTSDGDILGCPALDHAVAVLSLILSPVKERESFLQHYKPTFAESDWVVLDDALEEESTNFTTTWFVLSEEDVIQFMEQIPFDALFKHLLLIKGDGNVYDISRTTPSCFLKLFAFCARLLKIFCIGIQTYASPEHEGVCKRIARLMRHMVLFVTDHWEALKAFQVKNSHIQFEDDAMMARLQVEYDQFFERTVKAMFYSPRYGAWQFLADIPFLSLSLAKLAKIAYDLHVGYELEAFFDIEFSWLEHLASTDAGGRFCDHVKQLDDSSSYYLLTALSNMATQRTPNDHQFIKVVVSNIFEVSFVLEDTREPLHRTGRDLLSVIVTTHPFIVSDILAIIQNKINIIGSLSMYLFKFLDLSAWPISDTDFTCLSYWLLFMPASSLENQFARCALEKVNWGFVEGQLMHSRDMHTKVALVLVEAHSKVLESSTGNIITEGMKHVTSAIYSSSQEQVFLNWCWLMIGQLKLHQLDQSSDHVRRVLADPSLILEGIGDVILTPSLDMLKKGTLNKELLSIYTTMLLTSWGHSLPEFCNHGLDCLKALVEGGRLEAAITVLSVTTPLFFHQPRELSEDPKFIVIVSSILSYDQSYLKAAKSFVSREKMDEWQSLFAAMITMHVLQYKKYNLEKPYVITSFWIEVLTAVPFWKSNDSVLRLLDVICELAIFDEQWKMEIRDILADKIQPSDQSRMLNGLSNLLNWVVASTVDESKSLLVRYSNPELPWFALTALLAEVHRELKSGLWKKLLSTLHDNSEISVDCALKETCSSLGIEQVKANSLCIYRFGQQVLDMPVSHPAFPVTVQAFLTLHLSRVPLTTENLESNCCTMRFYEGYVNQHFLKKINTKVCQAFNKSGQELATANSSSYHNKVSSSRIDFLNRLNAMMNAFQNWMDDQRLYSAGLYLPALPPHFMTNKLSLIFQNCFEVWTEIIDSEAVNESILQRLKIWEKHRSFPSRVLSSPNHGKLKKNPKKSLPSEAILHRLSMYETPKSAPPLSNNRYCVANSKKFDIQSILFDVDRCTGIALERTTCVFMWSKELCALDCVYMEFLPQLWKNYTTQKTVHVKCVPGKCSKSDRCNGPAEISFEYCEKRLDDGVKVKLDQNREQHLAILNLSLGSPPLQFCQASVQLLNIVKEVCQWQKRNMAEGNAKQKKDGYFYGRKLFYLLVDLINDDNVSFPPFKELISTCVEALGQQFIAGQEDCQEVLAQNVLEYDYAKGSLLSPHFTPAVCSCAVYVQLYRSLTPHAVVEPDKVFMLMSKFEIASLLKRNSFDYEERKELLSIVCHTIISLMGQVDDSLSICIELCRIHLQAFLLHYYEDHHHDVLCFLLEMSAVVNEDPFNIGCSLWFDYINILSKAVIEFRPELTTEDTIGRMKYLALNMAQLQPQQIKELIEFLSSYFVKSRFENGLRGLYAAYKPFTKQIALLLAILSNCFMHFAQLDDSDKIILGDRIWETLENLWLPWISPLGDTTKDSCPEWIKQLTRDNTLLLPWGPWDIVDPTHTMAMFVSCVECLHQDVNGSRALSRILDYYCRSFAKREIKDHVLCVVHSQLSKLPWSQMMLNLQDVEIISRIMNAYLPECHSFIGNVFVGLQWKHMICSQTDLHVKHPQDTSLANHLQRIHVHLLNILLRVSCEPSVRMNGELRTLLVEAEKFEWGYVDAESFESILNWFIMSCDPRIVLNWDCRTAVDISVLRLIQVAAGYVPGSLKHPPHTHQKRCLLVRGLARLLVTTSNRHKQYLISHPSVFSESFAIMLTHMEDTVISAIPSHRQANEGFALASELMTVIGSSSLSNPLQNVCKDSTEQWLQGHHPSLGFLLPLISAICERVLQLQHRCPLLERALHSCIVHCSTKKVLSWTDIVNCLSFPPTNPGPLLTYAAQENHLLVIYGYIKWRVEVKGIAIGDEGMLISSLLEFLPLVDFNSAFEIGLILVIGEVLGLLRSEALKTGDKDIIWLQCQKFAEILATIGDDRCSKGLLGVIGLGRKSNLSPKTRLLSKGLSLFLSYQLVSPGVFRYVDDNRDIVERNSDRDKLCAEFVALQRDSSYAGLKAALDLVVSHCDDSNTYIRHSSKVFRELVILLFDRETAFCDIKNKTSTT